MGELMSRGMTWYEERRFQTLPLKCYMMLKRLRLEEREEAYLCVVYKANIPTAGPLSLAMSITSPSSCVTNWELSLLEG